MNRLQALRQRSFPGVRRGAQRGFKAAVALGALALALGHGAARGGLERGGELMESRARQVRVEDAGRFVLSIYANGADAWLHLQPKGDGVEHLFDARTGAELSRVPAGFATARRLGMVDAAEMQRTGSADRFEYLRHLGCGQQHQWCTVLDDSPVLVLASYSAAEQRLSWSVVDVRPLLHHGTALFAGRAQAQPLEAAERAVLDYAARHTDYATELQEAVESIDSIERLDALGATTSRLGLCQWRAITCNDRADAPVDLRRLRELQFIHVWAGAFARRLVEQPDAQSRQNLAQFLLKVTAPPFPAGDSAAHAVSTFQRFAPRERALIAQALKDYKGPDQLTVHCAGLWTEAAPCRAGAPAPALNVASGAGQGAQRGAAAVAALKPPSAKAPSAKAPWASQADEWNAIQKHADKLRLLNLNETQGVLARDPSSLGGVVFTAREKGKAGEGRYELSARIAEGSPVPVHLGAYRVKLELNLQYVREDRCAAKAKECIFTAGTKNEPVYKNETRRVTFTLQPGNGWQDVRTVSFGSLLPLTADGASLYRSELREARIVVKEVAPEPWVQI